MTDQALVELAFTMLEKSYVPYSRFPVGAALEGADGTVYTGCNVENAAYGSTLCAERTALVKAIRAAGPLPVWQWWATAPITAGPAAPAGRCSTSLPPTWRYWWPGRITPLSNTPCASFSPRASGRTPWPDPRPYNDAPAPAETPLRPRVSKEVS